MHSSYFDVERELVTAPSGSCLNKQTPAGVDFCTPVYARLYFKCLSCFCAYGVASHCTKYDNFLLEFFPFIPII